MSKKTTKRSRPPKAKKVKPYAFLIGENRITTQALAARTGYIERRVVLIDAAPKVMDQGHDKLFIKTTPDGRRVLAIGCNEYETQEWRDRGAGIIKEASYGDPLVSPDSHIIKKEQFRRWANDADHARMYPFDEGGNYAYPTGDYGRVDVPLMDPRVTAALQEVALELFKVGPAGENRVAREVYATLLAICDAVDALPPAKAPTK